jgi:large subunit ribosomal protein LP0
MSGIRKIAALSLQLHYPTLASVPHSLINGFKNLLAISVATEYTFPASEQIKAYLADPSAFATAAPATTAAATESKEDTPAKEQEPEEESDEDMGLDLFG